MKKIALFIVFLFLTMPAWPQTVLLRKIVTAGTGVDESPQIVRTSTGKYAVTWTRGVNGNEARIYGRLVDLSGAFGSAIKSNILGATIYRFSNYDLTALSSGGFLLTGTRNSDRQVVSRFFNDGFGAAGALMPSGITGYSPTVVATTSGFLLGEGDGYSQAFWARLDSHAHKLSDAARINASNSSNGFNLFQIQALPAGDFLFLGYERNPAGNTRAAAYNMPASVSGISAIIPYETAFAANNLGLDAATDTTGGFTLFGHAVSANRTAGKLRPLSTTGRPSSGAKAFPAGETNVFARYYRVIPLTGTGKFAVTWEEPGGGYIYLRLFNAHGVPVSAAIPLSPDQYQYPGGFGDLAWDADTNTLLAVWTEYTPSPGKTNVWIGLFRVS